MSWYNDENRTGDIVVTSRVRLARNVEGYPFPALMTDEMFDSLCERVKAAVAQSNTPFANSLKFISMNSVPDIQVKAMVERHLISPEFALNRKNKAIIISDDESVCVMIGEEDHIRIQVMYNGTELDRAYETADKLDSLLNSKLHFAFDTQLGFLTECPTNLGTGMRASVMLHLPLLEATGAIRYISESLNKIGFTVRGIYGEGSKPSAGLYQLSNQITLGISEKDALNNLKTIAHQIIEKERDARKNTDLTELTDSVCRAYGILKYARKLSTDEMMNYTSLVNLGVSSGILDIPKYIPVKILIQAQPHMLMLMYPDADVKRLDEKRAEYIRELL